MPRSEASKKQKRAFARAYHHDRRESRGYTTVNIPPDVRADLQEMKRKMQARLGLRPTDADVLRYLLKSASLV